MDQFILEITDKNIAPIIQDNSLVLVDFWADWCNPCVRFGEVVASLSKLYHGRAIIGKVNVDLNSDSVSRHQVKTIPTSIVFFNGLEVNRMVGYTELDAIQKILDQYLD